jgi:adenine specific DNA methylase Mod
VAVLLAIAYTNGMDTTGFYPLTPEQLSALDSGGGVMRGHDPATNRKYILIEQIEPTISDDYLREKLREGLEDIEAGRVTEWNADEFKRQLLIRHSTR